jgi:hypothetical protein
VRFSLAITGNLRAAMQQEVRDTARALRAAVDATGKRVQARLREQVMAAGFKGGGRNVANAWRMRVYPRVPGRSLRPSAMVWSNMPNVVDAFERGARVTAKGGKYLAIPTGFNRVAGRRQSMAQRAAGGAAGVRVSTAEMVRARGQAFIIRSKGNPRVALWCLRVSEAQRRSRGGRITREVWAANRIQVGTGRGTVAGLRPTAGRALLLERGFVPMFILVREVQHKKRLDVASVRRDAAGMLANAVAAEFSRMPRVVGMRA